MRPDTQANAYAAELLYDHRAGVVSAKGDAFGENGEAVATDIDELVTRGDLETTVSLAAGVTIVTASTNLLEVTVSRGGHGGDLNTAIVTPSGPPV